MEFGYWSSEAYVTDSSVKVSKQSDSEGIISVASDKNAEVILNIANPKNFNLVMPSAGNTEMIHFNAFDPQPVFGTDYMLEKLSSKALKLTYTAQFLKKYEWGQKDLGATLTMFADDGREFKKNYTFKIKSNTKPPQPSVILAQTNESTPHYVLCLTVPDMDTQVNGKKLHKDIAQIVINESSYELKINDLGSDFVKPTDESFITGADVVQLTGAEAVPAGYWILYYKTDREVGGAYKEYTVTLKDQRGLSSEKLETGTTTNKPAEETVTLNAGTQDSGGDGSNALPFIIQAAGTTPEAQIIISCASIGTTVHCTVTDVNTGTSNEYNGNPANVPLSLNGKNEKLYEVKYNTKGYGYNPTTLKTKYYKILKLHTVTFNANGGKFADDSTAKTESVLHGRTVTAPSASPTRVGNVFVGWYKEEDGTNEWNFTDDTVRRNTIIYAKWSDKAVEIKSDEDGAWKKLKEEAAKTNGVSVIVIEGEIKATTDSGNSGEITIGRNLTIQGKTGATRDKLNANGQNHRIFKVTGGKTLTLKNLTLKGGKGEVGGNGGGGIYAEGTLNMTDCTVTDNETDYGNGGGIYAESDLTMTRCTVSNNTVSDSSGLGGGIYIYVTGTHTMTNCTVTNNEAKYSHGGGIYAMGTLSMMNCTVTGNTAQSSGSGSGSGGGIYIDGTASLTMTGGTVTGNEAQSNGNGGGIYIGGNGSFTMTSGTVNNNKTEHGDGGGIYIDGTASLTMTGGTLAGNEAVNNKTGGGVYVNGTFTMKGTAYVTPSADNAKGSNDVYLANGKMITVDGALTGTAPVARITPATYAITTQVLTGSITAGTSPNQNYTKFTVTPQTLSGGKILYWEADASGKLMRIVDSVKYPDKAWKALKDVVSVAGADPITINGRIQATDDADNKGTININGPITIKGKNGRDTDILDAGKKGDRIFIINDSLTNKLTLEKLTLKGGFVNGNDGAAILVGRDAEAELSACTIEDCEALNGGAIAILATGTATLTNTDIKNCSAKLFSGNTPPNGSGGAVYAAGGTVIMTNCTLTGNTAENNGGAVYAKKTSDLTPILSTVTIEGGTIGGAGTNANKATGTGEGLGGGIYIGESCVLNMKDYTDSSNNKHGAKVISNTAKAKGGAIYTKGGKVTMTNCTLKGNEAKSGGAICAEKDGSTPSNVTISGGTIGGTGADANKATGTDSDNGFGGAVFIKGSTVNINGCTLEGNKAKNGGGVYMEGGNCTLNGSLKNNTTTELASSYGGSIYLENGTLTMKTGAEISGSEASVSGGGVYISAHDGGAASFTMEGGTISGCKVSSAYEVYGGGVCVEVEHGSTGTANFIMQGGSITGCEASSGGLSGFTCGGGVCVKNRATFNMTGGSITGCKAVIDDDTGSPQSQGGGVYVDTNSTFNMSGSSITGCTAEGPSPSGGGVYVYGSTTTFTMKDSAVITPPSEVPSGINRFNDVYLADAKIRADSSLTPPGGIAARITPDSYNTTTQVLTAGTGVTLENETYKFAVTPKIVSGTPQPWTVDRNGVLKQGRYTEVPYNQLGTYLANNASATEVNYIEVTGISAGDLKGTAGSSSNPANPGPLGQKIKSIYPKKVALKLPDGLSVTDMSNCFALCKNLISVENIPSGVTDMQACFYECENLTTVPAIPATVRGMLECFRFCRSLTTAPNIPSGVNSMAYCFDGCTSLTTAPNIPSGVNSMAYCFNGCTSLTTVPNIPATVTSMAYCFNGCKSLTQCPDIPSSVTDMRYCFGNCTVLKRVKINRGYAGCDFYNTFKDCTSLQDGGIQVLSTELTNYQNAADFMGTTANKFSATP